VLDLEETEPEPDEAAEDGAEEREREADPQGLGALRCMLASQMVA
jgi:hypothetical protein